MILLENEKKEPLYSSNFINENEQSSVDFIRSTICSDLISNIPSTDNYNIFISNTLEWPSLMISWFDQIDQNDIDKIILGTNTSGKESNNIIITNLQKDKISDKNKIYIDSKINFNTPVVKAKQAPKNPNLFSVSATNGEIKIFDYLKYNKKNSFTEAQFFLQGHINKVNGLCWNLTKEGVLISGSDDSKVFLWDVNNSRSSNILYPIKKFNSHIKGVNDVAWNKPELFASCSDDKKIVFYDQRQNIHVKQIENAHKLKINSIDFNKSNENLLISGSDDCSIGLWDLRNLNIKIHSFMFHSQEVKNVRWNNFNHNIFASASNDKSICIWDMDKFGNLQSIVEEEEGPSELLFCHKKHVGYINDFAWYTKSYKNYLLIASVDSQNLIQIWSPSNK